MKDQRNKELEKELQRLEEGVFNVLKQIKTDIRRVEENFGIRYLKLTGKEKRFYNSRLLFNKKQLENSLSDHLN